MKNPSYRYGTYALITSFFLFFIVQMFRAYIELSPEFLGENLGEYGLTYFPISALIVGLVFFSHGWWVEDEKKQREKLAVNNQQESNESV
ncbi:MULTISPECIES: hypothetical protein [Exiguobacterium]|uniref:hypothetical protein n=1 Tax=Exiguobacterium acetylicum TaxID=41170 RepID=UPI001EE19C9F|nr:hypothetical protein [Exiguobacterium acetylicum]UKS57328.1 hypothetical protein K6T22_06875 [Exiguobacterium acetylicum]